MCSFKQILVIVVLIYVITAISADDEYKVIETISGRIRGIRKTTLLKNIPFYSFKGISYAKPPIGELRFKVNIEYGTLCVTKKLRTFVKTSKDKSIT